MNPAILKLLRDYMARSSGAKYQVDPETQAWDDYVQETSAKDVEGMESAMQEGMMSDAEDSIISDLVTLDQRELVMDSVGIYEKNDPVYARIETERAALTKKLADEKNKRRGHSRYGRSGGGGFPRDILESKVTPRGLLGPRKRKY